MHRHLCLASVCRQVVLVAACGVTLQCEALAQVPNQDVQNQKQNSAAQVAQHPSTPATSDEQHVIGATNPNLESVKGNVATPKTSTTPASGQRITSETDLPRIRYPLRESASSLVIAGNTDFDSFLSHYAPDLNTLLAGFSIENKELLLRLLEAQEDAAILMGDRKAAETALEKRKNLETTPTEQTLVGLSDYSFLHAWKKAGADHGDAFQKAYADEYAHRVNALRWATVGAEVKVLAAQCESAQPAPQMEYVKVHLDPEAAALHAVTLGHADRIVLARKAMQFDQPTQAPRCAILTSYVGSHAAPMQASTSERK